MQPTYMPNVEAAFPEKSRQRVLVSVLFYPTPSLLSNFSARFYPAMQTRILGQCSLVERGIFGIRAAHGILLGCPIICPLHAILPHCMYGRVIYK